MISLKDNRTALLNLKSTIHSLEQLDSLIKFYSIDKPGPAYCTFEHIDAPIEVKVQFDRSFIVTALKEQRRII